MGCVYVKDGSVVAIGRNRTNELRNATKHAEIVAFDELRAFRPYPSTSMRTTKRNHLFGARTLNVMLGWNCPSLHSTTSAILRLRQLQPPLFHNPHKKSISLHLAKNMGSAHVLQTHSHTQPTQAYALIHTRTLVNRHVDTWWLRCCCRRTAWVDTLRHSRAVCDVCRSPACAWSRSGGTWMR